MANLILGFLHSPLEDKRKFLIQFFGKIRTSSELPLNKHEWDEIQTLYNQLLRLGTHMIANAIFFITIAGSYSLLQCVDESFTEASERLFFRNHWIPTLHRLTELLRISSSQELESVYAQYSHSLIQCWVLKIAAFNGLERVNPIRLVHMNLPQIEDPSEHPQ